MDDRTRSIYFELFNEIGIIHQLARTIMESRMPDGLILPHFSVLNHLIRVEDGQTPLILAQAFQVPKTSMTHTLSGLEKHGFVEMRPNPRDGRSKCVWITGAGRQFRDETIRSLDPDLDDLAKSWMTVDAESVTRRLTVLRKLMDDMRNGTD